MFRFLLLPVVIAGSSVLPAWAAARVEFDLASASPNPIAARQWYQTLQSARLDGVRISQARGTVQAKIENLGSAAAPRYKVSGYISSRGVLVVPGGQFTTRDQGRIRAWVSKLREQGPGAVTGATRQERLPYGLTADELAKIRVDLARKVETKTTAVETLPLFRTLTSSLTFPVSLGPGTAPLLESADPMTDELKGVAAGTALAHLLRPAGLALEVRKTGGKLHYAVIIGRDSKEPWPVGGPSAEPDKKTLPVMLELLNAEFDAVEFDRAVAALQGRMKVPFLYDRNNMVRHGIETKAVQVTIPARRLTYQRLLGSTLAQAKLKFELRVDEAEAPFLWITTVKR